ncbi:HD-GYP domain-containing protein [Candidatus Nitrotoga sp. M5]|uniref:HD-GYP domain-containing protein n=1 Tax=Candidatus Nitrotoga sp. M5 TaxID=2890409 RepID=UPI001EF676FB|nr:two-component system response regulator [Candidatus Nitrotoga sp. M5]CAH1387234.1 putative cyclic di-GMP phosphodiesterase VC_1348 [Candidatus Nitrotoga sp. M5]
MNSAHKNSLLVVDDTPDNIRVLCDILDAEYAIKIANSGELALEIVAQQPPDLILLDVMMPGMSGHDVCRQLKKNENTQHIPIIFITAHGDVENEALGFELGAADYITKPVNLSVVRARVRTHLALANQHFHLEQLVAERTSELKKSNLQLEQSHLVILQQLGRAADYRDNETGKHVVRVGSFSKLLGLASGLSKPQSELLMYAAMMHDIGKIGIPDHILLKPGKLTVDEFEIMKRHPLIGAEIIGDHDAEVMQMAKQISLGHHEKWNGKGYPYGLSGESIPLVGRIVAIADVFDALTSVRPYKRAWSVDSALDLLRKEAGQHFDPNLIKLFLSMETEMRHIVITYSDATDE